MARRGVAGWYGWVLARLSWLVAAAGVCAAAAAVLYLPALRTSTGGAFGGAIPRGAPAAAAQREIVRSFHVPLLSDIAVVERDRNGLGVAEQVRLVRLAVRLSRHRAGYPQIRGAIPVTNAAGLFPSSREAGTTGILYVFITGPDAASRLQVVHRLIHRQFPHRHGVFVGVTGPVPAQVTQNALARSKLQMVELAAVVAIAVIVGVTFRCIGAAAVTLIGAIIAYLISIRLLGWVGQHAGVPVPGQLEPLLVVLVAGVMTDYSVFFLSAYRRTLAETGRPRDATAAATAQVTPIVATAGVAVAAGVATLKIARLDLFNRLGPGMAIAVAVSLLVAITVVPALMGTLGRLTFWPRRMAGLRPKAEESTRDRPRTVRARLIAAETDRRTAPVLLMLALAVLGAAAWRIAGIGTGADLVSGLPADAEPAQAAAAAGQGFSPGITAPTEILIRRHGIGDHRPELARLQRLLSHQPGVAGVIGPADVPVRRHFGIMLAHSGNAARYILILHQQPYGTAAIHTVQRLRRQLPDLARTAGLSHAHPAVAGFTAISADLVSITRTDLIHVGALALGVLLVILLIFLRAVAAPVLLLAASVLAVIAALGLTNWVFQDLLHQPGLTFYVPFAAAILLLSFGSDYNIFLIGRIWRDEAGQPLREGIFRGTTRASAPITTAGITLAISFALLALVPLAAFREFAFTMLTGILLDTFIVRSLLVPSLLTLLGGAASWPSHRLTDTHPPTDQTPTTPPRH